MESTRDLFFQELVEMKKKLVAQRAKEDAERTEKLRIENEQGEQQDRTRIDGEEKVKAAEQQVPVETEELKAVHKKERAALAKKHRTELKELSDSQAATLRKMRKDLKDELEAEEVRKSKRECEREEEAAKLKEQRKLEDRQLKGRLMKAFDLAASQSDDTSTLKPIIKKRSVSEEPNHRESSSGLLIEPPSKRVKIDPECPGGGETDFKYVIVLKFLQQYPSYAPSHSEVLPSEGFDFITATFEKKINPIGGVSGDENYDLVWKVDDSKAFSFSTNFYRKHAIKISSDERMPPLKQYFIENIWTISCVIDVLHNKILITGQDGRVKIEFKNAAIYLDFIKWFLNFFQNTGPNLDEFLMVASEGL